MSVHADTLVPDLLDEYGRRARARLLEYVPSREPRGYLYDLLSDYPRRGGRALRPSLCLATVRAFGGSLELALASAVSIEILHNALLIHDDVQDDSEVRRGRPAMHIEHGVPVAINAGDCLALLALRPLMDNVGTLGPHLAFRVMQETEHTAWESAEGQALELGWRRDNLFCLGEAEYLEMVLKKTAWLTVIHPSRIGALIATRDAIDLEPFIRFGFLVGAAFQIQDDLLNLIGNQADYGKELNGDLREGKRTLMLIHAFDRAHPDEADELRALMLKPRSDRTPQDVAWIRSMMERLGSIEHAQQLAQGLAGAALHEFAGIFGQLPASRDRDFIERLATWVIHRT